jgi:hypothetical protein
MDSQLSKPVKTEETRADDCQEDKIIKVGRGVKAGNDRLKLV